MRPASRDAPAAIRRAPPSSWPLISAPCELCEALARRRAQQRCSTWQSRRNGVARLSGELGSPSGFDPPLAVTRHVSRTSRSSEGSMGVSGAVAQRRSGEGARVAVSGGRSRPVRFPPQGHAQISELGSLRERIVIWPWIPGGQTVCLASAGKGWDEGGVGQG